MEPTQTDFEFAMQCRLSFPFFCEKVLKLEISEFHKEIMQLPLNHRYLCVVIPTGHSKTTIFSYAYPLWKLWKETEKEICLVSSSLDQSMRILAKAQFELEDNPFFESLLPNNRPETWNKSQLNTANKNQFYIKPFNSSARGIHPNCITPDSFVDTIDGAEKIRNLQIGMFVKTHKGRYKKITKIMNRKHYGYVYEIVAGKNILKITGEHPVLSYRIRKRTNQSIWVKANRLKSGDYVCFPNHGKEATLYITNAKPKTNQNILPKFVFVDREISRLLGLYVAEGSLQDGGRITFSFNPKEKEYLDFVEKTMLKKFGLKAMHDLHNSWVHQLSFHSKKLSKVFEKKCGRGAHNKKVPFELLRSQITKASFVKGWLEGDGSKGSHCCASSVSKTLIVGIEKICIELGIKVNISETKNNNYSSGLIYKMDFYYQGKNKIETLYSAKKGYNFSYSKIESITKKENGQGKVWNLEVEEDNSYIANGIIVHNCIIYDDLLRETDMSMDQIKEIFWGIFYPRGQLHNCQHIVVGTPQTIEDLYAELEKKPEWFVIRKPAVETESSGKWIKPLWPEKFSLQKLREIKEDMGDYRFSREFMCQPVSIGDVLFPQELILNATDDNLEFSYNSKGTVSIGCDFAMSNVGDYNVFTVIDAVTEPYEKKTDSGTITINNPIFIRHITRYKGGTGQTKNIETLFKNFNAQKIVADSSSFGARFVQELRENHLPVDAQDFRPENRNLLLLNLRKLLDQNRLVIPTKGYTKPMTDILMRELSGFKITKTSSGRETFKSTTKHDDMVMSLSLAVKNISNQPKQSEMFFYGV